MSKDVLLRWSSVWWFFAGRAFRVSVVGGRVDVVGIGLEKPSKDFGGDVRPMWFWVMVTILAIVFSQWRICFRVKIAMVELMC